MKRTIRGVIVLLLVVVMLLSTLTGCGSSRKPDVSNKIYLGETHRFETQEVAEALLTAKGIPYSVVDAGTTSSNYLAEVVADWSIKGESGYYVNKDETIVLKVFTYEPDEPEPSTEPENMPTEAPDETPLASPTATLQPEASEASNAVKSSPDKYTWYMKDYTGKNAASIGYISMIGDHLDKYGNGVIKLVFVNPEGSYMDDEQLKEYIVVGQSLPINTEIKYVFAKDEDGNEHDYWVGEQNYSEIVIGVNKIGEASENILPLTAIKPTPDKSTWYVRDYNGHNLASIGYQSIRGDIRDKYGESR